MTDASKMYHSVRGQETLKLYVIFNVLEVRSSSSRFLRIQAHAMMADCGPSLLLLRTRSSGLPLLTPDPRASHRRYPPSHSPPRFVWSQSRLRRCVLLSFRFALADHMRTVAHTLVLFYQLVTLNVAINSYSNALLTLLLSNQFVEIKGSVFKKFEKENLFQLTCAGTFAYSPASRHFASYFARWLIATSNRHR